MLYQLPSLSKYHKVLHKFNAHIGYGHIETAFVLGDESYGERELFIIQKRPHNSGRIDTILLGYLNEDVFNEIREGRVQQATHLARNVLDVHMGSISFPIGEFRYQWRCNANGIILVIRVRAGNGKVYLYQHRREGQSSSSGYRNNIIVLGSIEDFESLFMYITMEILGQPSPGGLFDEENTSREIEPDSPSWTQHVELAEERREEESRRVALREAIREHEHERERVVRLNRRDNE